MDRVFLGADILFSAARKPAARLRVLWSLPQTELVTSQYVLDEARRNLVLRGPQAVAALDELALSMTLTSGMRAQRLPQGVELDAKDVPVLLAAIDSGCTHLLTGNLRHFGHLYGRRVAGVLVQTPREYLHGSEARQ